MCGRSNATKFDKEIDTITKVLEHLEAIVLKIILDFLKFNFEGTFSGIFFFDLFHNDKMCHYGRNVSFFTFQGAKNSCNDIYKKCVISFTFQGAILKKIYISEGVGICSLNVCKSFKMIMNGLPCLIKPFI